MIRNELTMKSERMAAHSATGTMADLFEGQKDRLGEYLKPFRLAYARLARHLQLNEGVVALECFGYQQTFGKFFPKLVQSYRLDAPDWLDESEKT